MGAQWKTEGVSALWPEINGPFLSLRGMADAYHPEDEIQKTYKQLLAGFDAITGCEMKELYRFRIALDQMSEQTTSIPEMFLIHKAFTAWVNFEYDLARMLFTQHIRAYPSDIIALFFLHMLDFCTGKTWRPQGASATPDVRCCHVYPIQSPEYRGARHHHGDAISTADATNYCCVARASPQHH